MKLEKTKKKNGVTDGSMAEPAALKFNIEVMRFHVTKNGERKHFDIIGKKSIPKEQIGDKLRTLIETQNLSFSESAKELGISLTTVRRISRTLKIGYYRDPLSTHARLKSPQVPFGWKSIHGYLEKYPIEWGWIEQMWQFRREGKSLHWIATEMAKLGIKTKNGGKWYAKTISQILKYNHHL